GGQRQGYDLPPLSQPQTESIPNQTDPPPLTITRYEPPSLHTMTRALLVVRDHQKRKRLR
ncbi:putative PPE family protein PPE24, partial [Dissostichus eleginoides]